MSLYFLLSGRALDFETEGPWFVSRQWQFSLLHLAPNEKPTTLVFLLSLFVSPCIFNLLFICESVGLKIETPH
jgi:hypothetical protein